ncbi:phosphohydrolase [Clostridia bacterium]|nr:phosphohydrolase [Clostridia bacterium]
MTDDRYKQIEAYMQSQMSDSAHDKEHVYRVLNYALEIAKFEQEVNLELLITAALLHDIGRAEQFATPTIDHATLGADKAKNYLLSTGYEPEFADAVSAAISSHRFRSDNPPFSIEAKILFDADKIDVCGVMGMVRGVQYKAHTGEPLYTFNPNGSISDGTENDTDSLFHEYKFKLEKIYDRFYTKRGADLGEKRRKAAADFYNSLLAEVRECYQSNIKEILV